MADSPARRKLLMGMGASFVAAALDGCAIGLDNRRAQATSAPRLALPRIHATPDLITRITVCTRPFRAEGPRIEVEQIGSCTVVHNYGHGGSGWSLSWGSSALAVDLAMGTGRRDIAVIGCGALGITSAILLQRAGARVTIYAKDLPPNVRSSLATGVWSPDSRICLEASATPAFRQRWETMARKSFDTYQTLIGLPNNPIEFFDSYYIQDVERPHRRQLAPADPRPKFAELEGELLADLQPESEQFEAGTHPFGNRTLSRRPLMMYNINTYQRMLMAEFQANGGQIEVREFHSPAEFSSLPQKTLIHATGYGARALLGDLSITPVRGQLARMAPQPGINYGIFYNGVAFVPRRDGFVFQVIGDSDYYGYGDDTSVPSRPEAELAVSTIRGLYADA
jgi:glycine/D-amino acid oxidase-like deaminating enzyme